MPMNMQDIDDSISKGGVDAETMQAEVEKDFTKPYDKARAEASWYQVLQQFTGMPGKMAEQSLLAGPGAGQYKVTKQRFIDAMGGKNGTDQG
jgi:hypothetical protein